MQHEVEVEIRDLGNMAYGECWDLQRTLFDALCKKKAEKRLTDGEPRGTILIVEHPAVYTLGKSGHQENMLVTEEYLKSLGAEFFHIDRGGDITFHGEGQVVCYPIIDLEKLGIGLRRYIEILEQSIIIGWSDEYMNDKTAVVAIMMANNEVGTIQPIKEAAKIAHENGALMFTDAVQAVGNVKIDLSELDVDMLAMSGHKIHAPKGIGLLFVRKGKVLENLIDGGGQEQRRRGGTENLPYALALAKAIEIADSRLAEVAELTRKRDRLIEALTKIPYSKLNGHRTERLPGNVNIGFEFIEGESLLLMLDIAGICASTGSACSSASLEASHVLLSMGVPHEKAHGSLRLSISYETTDEDIDYIIETVPPIVQRLREMSPLWEEIVNANKV